jgi:hypothetical protein
VLSNKIMLTESTSKKSFLKKDNKKEKRAYKTPVIEKL